MQYGLAGYICGYKFLNDTVKPEFNFKKRSPQCALANCCHTLGLVPNRKHIGDFERLHFLKMKKNNKTGADFLLHLGEMDVERGTAYSKTVIQMGSSVIDKFHYNPDKPECQVKK